MSRIKPKNLAALLLVLVGAAFVVIGVARGENQTVLTKAINICLECIGIG